MVRVPIILIPFSLLLRLFGSLVVAKYAYLAFSNEGRAFPRYTSGQKALSHTSFTRFITVIHYNYPISESYSSKLHIPDS